MQFFDVRDPSNIKEVGSIPVANHTAECVLDCQWFYGRAGTIIDARGILDGTPPKVAGNWITELKAQGVDSKSCHHIREIRPGVILTACRPFSVITVNPEDAPGASPEHPKVLYTGESDAFVHSARWPRGGRDKFVLTGGETNFTGRCDGANGEFRTYSAEAREGRQLAPPSRDRSARLQPAGNGTYTDGKPPANHLGCSVHWFQEHSSVQERRPGRAVRVRGRRALPADQARRLDQGAGLLRAARRLVVVAEVGPERRRRLLARLRPRHRHHPLEGRALRAEAARATGVKRERRRVRGTNGTSVLPALNARQQTRRTTLSDQLRSQGWSPMVCQLAALR